MFHFLQNYQLSYLSHHNKHTNRKKICMKYQKQQNLKSQLNTRHTFLENFQGVKAMSTDNESECMC